MDRDGHATLLKHGFFVPLDSPEAEPLLAQWARIKLGLARSDIPEEIREGTMVARVYQCDDGEFVVADGGGWLPGSFPTRDAAVDAARTANGLVISSLTATSEIPDP